MKSPACLMLPALASVALLAGCAGGEQSEKAPSEGDPAVASALGDEIMVDPELAGQQDGPGPVTIELPPEQRTPEAVAAARAQAVRLAGGSIEPAPAPTGGDVAKLVANTATAAQIAAAGRTGNVDCAAKVQYSASWATSLPDVLAVYPQGAVQEAAGANGGGCRLRVVSFLTPVAPGEIIDFYYTRVRSGGYDARYQRDGEDHVLGGNKPGASYLVYARELDNGLTEVDLVASGG